MTDEPKTDLAEKIREVVRRDGRYPLEAYAFLDTAIKRAAHQVHGPGPLLEHSHVTGQQVCLAARELAIEQWGMLAPAVLQRWNIHGTIDFGHMVYLMVENGIMGKKPEDSIEDFRGVFDFATAFDVAEWLELKE